LARSYTVMLFDDTPIRDDQLKRSSAVSSGEAADF
jgi:hypothetical protein